MMVVGIILLLPGACGVILAVLDPHEMKVDLSWMLTVLGLIALGVCGIVLIRGAVRRPG
jgi:hypothetical protein